jgi:hypothetical protein
LDGIPTFVKNFLSLLSPVAMSFGFSQISSWDSRAIGLQWENIASPVSPSNQGCIKKINKSVDAIFCIG